MSIESKFKSKQYRNWVRGTLGLCFLQEGLSPFTDRVVTAEHRKIIQKHTSCTQCNCRKKIYDDIVKQHRFGEPNRKAYDSTWYNDHWQFAKCFLTTTTKGSNNTAKDTDASGLLSIIINGKFFQSELQCTIDSENPTYNIFSQVRNMRNEILHKSTLQLTDNDVIGYLNSMIDVLEDKKVLCSDPAAKAAVQKLKEIRKTDLHISTDEEAKAIQTAVNAINEAKEIAIQKIDAATEEATAGVSSTVSKVFDDTYEPEIKNIKTTLEDHETRIRTNEEELKTLNKRVAELEDLRKKYQTRLEYLNQVKDLQTHLMDKYERDNVNTWISPLMTQHNNVNIRKVYVPPSMVDRENKGDNDGNTNGPGGHRGRVEKPIEEYRDLFGTEEKRNRNIFIIGDVGTGKSSFTKMMMQNWCSSFKQRRINESGAMEERAIKDIRNMDRFDVLFYIPLREIREGTNDIIDMIKDQLPKKYLALVDDIFRNDSGRVLIIADGLDEWTPPKSIGRKGLPKYSQASGSTIVTTSRPSSLGILNLKSSEYDLKITMLGLKHASVYPMVEKYMKLLDKTSSDVVAFRDVLRNLPFRDVHNAPMLLQQIIWLYCNKKEIGQSRSVIYLHIINALLAWGHDKLKECSLLNSEKVHLPTSFTEYPRCKENQNLLLVLGTIAHDAYITGNNSSLVFSPNKLEQRFGVSKEDINTIVQTGILTEVNCADPTYENTQLSFIHTSYAEFFAALYICSLYSKPDNADSSETTLALLERLIAVTPETSVTEILRLENVLIMICGLFPGLTENVCECIYNLTPRDANMEEDKYNEVKSQIHALTSKCISEHNAVDQKVEVRCKLRHIYQRGRLGENTMLASYLDPSSIETCCLFGSRLLHEQCSALSSCLSQATLLETLELYNVKCTSPECEGHFFDMSGQNQLHDIVISLSMIFVNHINRTCVKKCDISNCQLSHEQSTSLCTFLSQAESLREIKLSHVKCTESACAGHYIDLKNHKQLRNLSISNCNMISFTGINHTSLKRFDISRYDLSHEQYAALCTFISQAELLQEIKLSHIKCTEDACEGHCINLTKHKWLWPLSISDCNMISITGINPTFSGKLIINNCNLSHEQCALLCLSIPNNYSGYIELTATKCTKDKCDGHFIDNPNNCLIIHDCANIYERNSTS